MQVRTTLMGICNTYLLGPVKDRYLLVDAGTKGKEKIFFRNLKHWNISPLQIDYIILTHAHHDHVGALPSIKRATKAEIIIHQEEARVIEKGIITIPKGVTGLGKIISGLGKLFLEGKQHFEPVQAEHIVNQHEYSLDNFGFPLTILHTPGHTKGSISVIDKAMSRAFVGDTMFNIPKLLGGKIQPPFADEAALLPYSWENLLNLQLKYYYPAHGKRIPKSLLEKEHMTGKNSF